MITGGDYGKTTTGGKKGAKVDRVGGTGGKRGAAGPDYSAKKKGQSGGKVNRGK
jgi:hypothetical protein